MRRSPPPARRKGLSRVPRERPVTGATFKVPRGSRCAVCGRKWPLESHHVTPQQLLRRVARERGLYAPALLSDARNRLVLCSGPQSCHARHEAAFRRVPRGLVPAEALEFAADLGLEWYIERTYPGEEGG